MIRRAPLLGLVALLGACGAAVDDHANPDRRCNPLSEAGRGCFLPFPSSYYLAADASTATGLRVAIPRGVLPKNQVGGDYDPARLDVLDGFSPATQILADLGARVDPAQLLPEDGDYGAALAPTAPVQLIAFDTGERVPLFAEVDANVRGETEPQLLLVHPAVRLRPATRYVVALRGLVDTHRQPIVVRPFQALVAGRLGEGSPLAAVKARTDELLALVERQGVPRSSLTLAWDFTTASDRHATGHLLAMRDAAFARWEKEGLGITVESDEPSSDPHLLRVLKGSFDVPSFLTDNTSLYAGLELDDRNRPVDTGTNYRAHFVLTIPACAHGRKAPLPVLIFGHGLFGAAEQIDTDQQRMTADALCMVELATHWVGLSTVDETAVVAKVFASFDTIWQPTDRLQQGVVNFLVLARLAARKLRDLPALMEGGAPVVDGKELYYFGISQGGIMGNTLLALSPELERGALNAGAGIYSFMLTRSGDFATFKGIMDGTYPSQVDQEVMLALSQSLFDYSDPITFVGHAVRDPLPDEHGAPMKPKHVLQQEGRYDAEVPNLATRVLVRTAGLPALGPVVEPVYGVPVVAGPVDAAYTQWDVKATPHPPKANLPAPGNAAHNGIGKLPKLLEQLHLFFRPDGRIVQTCDGPCVFDAPP